MSIATVELAPPTPEHRRLAAQNFERANQVLRNGDYRYASELLLNCCQLDPGNLIYRKALRQVGANRLEKTLGGKLLARLRTVPARLRFRTAKWSARHRDTLAIGERILTRNPWDPAVHLAMATAAEQLGLLPVAVWIMEQGRQFNPKNLRVCRTLAQVYEKNGNFSQAIILWDQVSKANPKDFEAARKGKDLAARHTIARGQYEEATFGTKSTSAIRNAEPETATDPTAALENRFARQIEPLRSKIEADPTNPNPYLSLASIYKSTGRWDEARQTLEEGLAAAGRHFELQLALSELEIEPFRVNLRLTEEKLKANPDNDLQRMRHDLLKEINTREMELFRQRADRFPTDLAPRMELGVRLLRAGQTDAAIAELQQARRDPRHRWRALWQLGYCFQAKRNWPLAKRNFEEALQALPPGEEETRKDLLYQLAKGAAETRDWQAAIELGNELANLDFGHRDIGPLLDAWQAKLGQHG